jgi:signal transduction histidine kinase
MKTTLRYNKFLLDTLQTAGMTQRPEDARMSDHLKSNWDKARSEAKAKVQSKLRGKRRLRRRNPSRHDEGELFGSDDDHGDIARPHTRVLSSEEQEYQDARTDAEDRAELLISTAKQAIIVLLLLVFVPWLGFAAILYWFFRHGRRFFSQMVEPRLKERLVEEQVERHVHANVSRERVELADDHAQSLEVLSASVAHEIRNPITAAKSLLQQMREDPNSIDNEEYAQVALVELERVERSISHLLKFGREEELHRAPLLMRDVLDSALETFRERSEREGIAIEREFDCDGEMHGDAEKLRRVMINLVGNALDALAEAQVTEPVVHVSMGENLAGNEVWVRVRDNGLGIDQEIQDQIFTPFYTANRNGTGLGLAITKKLVDAHRGKIEVSAVPGSGAEFILSLPKGSPSAFQGDRL